MIEPWFKRHGLFNGFKALEVIVTVTIDVWLENQEDWQTRIFLNAKVARTMYLNSVQIQAEDGRFFEFGTADWRELQVTA